MGCVQHLPKGVASASEEVARLGAGECSLGERGLLLVRSMCVHSTLWMRAPPSGRSSMYMLAACARRT